MSIAAKPWTAVDPRRRPTGSLPSYQQVFKDLEHPAVPVGQVKHEVGQRLRRVVELEDIAAGKYPWIWLDHPSGSLRIALDQPVDCRLDSGADVCKRALRHTGRAHPLDSSLAMSKLPLASREHCWRV